MTSYDRLKLIKSGFTIFRTHTSPLICITKTNSKGNWIKHDTYVSVAAMEREEKRINEHEPTFIFD